MPFKNPESRRAYEKERGARRRSDPTYQAAQKAYKEEHKEELSAYQLQWQRDNRTKMRDAQAKSRYGIPHGTYDRVLSEQGGKCALCGAVEPGGRGRFHIDHDHRTGKLRGLLCFACNVGLGKLGDTVEALRRAIAYLEKSNLQVRE